MTADREAGLTTFSLYRASLASIQTILLLTLYTQSSNSMEAFKEANNVVSGLVDGSVGFRCFVFQFSGVTPSD